MLSQGKATSWTIGHHALVWTWIWQDQQQRKMILLTVSLKQFQGVNMFLAAWKLAFFKRIKLFSVQYRNAQNGDWPLVQFSLSHSTSASQSRPVLSIIRIGQVEDSKRWNRFLGITNYSVAYSTAFTLRLRAKTLYLLFIALSPEPVTHLAYGSEGAYYKTKLCWMSIWKNQRMINFTSGNEHKGNLDSGHGFA